VTRRGEKPKRRLVRSPQVTSS